MQTKPMLVLSILGALLALAASCGSSRDNGSDTTTFAQDDTATDTDSDSMTATNTDSDSGSQADSDSLSDSELEGTLVRLSPAELHEALANKDFPLINVHIPDAGEIPGTDTHISYLQIDDLVSYIGGDLEKKAVIYCLTNHMALIAGNQLLARGYRGIHYLDGGMTAWVAAGYELDP